MNLINFICFTLFLILSGNAYAMDPSDFCEIENMYAAGAAGQKAQCPHCGQNYICGTHHKCPPKSK